MKTILLIILACLAFASTALAVDPPPGGGYPGGNTALGMMRFSVNQTV
jgi:hypothetical protein